MFIAKPNDGTRRVEKKPQMGLGGYVDSYLGSPDPLGGGGGNWKIFLTLSIRLHSTHLTVLHRQTVLVKVKRGLLFFIF
jgi:hypothetical protein